MHQGDLGCPHPGPEAFPLSMLSVHCHLTCLVSFIEWVDLIRPCCHLVVRAQNYPDDRWMRAFTRKRHLQGQSRHARTFAGVTMVTEAGLRSGHMLKGHILGRQIICRWSHWWSPLRLAGIYKVSYKVGGHAWWQLYERSPAKAPRWGVRSSQGQTGAV